MSRFLFWLCCLGFIPLACQKSSADSDDGPTDAQSIISDANNAEDADPADAQLGDSAVAHDADSHDVGNPDADVQDANHEDANNTNDSGQTDADSGQIDPPPFQHIYVYLALPDDNLIALYELNPNTGQLTQKSPTALNKARTLRLGADGARLYASSDTHLVSFSLNGATGSLTQLNQVSVQQRATYLALDRNSGFLASVYYGDAEVRIYQLAADGRFSPGPILTAQRSTPQHPHSLSFTPDNTKLLIPHTSARTILNCDFNATTGTLQNPNQCAAFQANPAAESRHLVWHPDQQHIFVANEEDDSVSVFHYNANTQSYTELQTLSILENGRNPINFTGSDVVVTQDGRFVYVASRDIASNGQDAIAAFAYNSQTEQLQLIDHYPIAAITRVMAIDPSDQYLFAGSTTTGTLVSYKIDASSGSLSQRQDTQAGQNIFWVTTLGVP